MTAAYIISKVSPVYGDAKPRVVHVETTHTEASPRETMYVIQLAGRFHRGHVGAAYLAFSALAARWYVWGVRGYDVHYHLRWIDATLRKP